MQVIEFSARAAGQIAAQFAEWTKTTTVFAWVFASMIAATGPAWAAGPTATLTGPKASASEQIEGVFTGTYQNGRPVYRLPTINVTADRKTEVAKIEQEEKQAREKQAGAKQASARVVAAHMAGSGSPTSAAKELAPATCASCEPVAVIR